jgi:hypothetical protein
MAPISRRIEENLKQNYDSAYLLHNLKCSPSFYPLEMESRYKEYGGRKEGKKTGEKEYPRFPSELEADALQERALRHDRIVRGTSMET